MDSIRKHKMVKLVNKWQGRYVEKNLSPVFYNSTFIDEDLTAIKINKLNLQSNKPAYVGIELFKQSDV